MTNGNLSQCTSGNFVLRFPQIGENQDRTERHTWFLTVPTSTWGCWVRPLPGSHMFCFVIYFKWCSFSLLKGPPTPSNLLPFFAHQHPSFAVTRTHESFETFACSGRLQAAVRKLSGLFCRRLLRLSLLLKGFEETGKPQLVLDALLLLPSSFCFLPGSPLILLIWLQWRVSK